MKYHIGMDFKNEYADLFCVKGLNSNAMAIADYSKMDGAERILFADFISEKQRKTFIHNCRELYKGARF